MTKPIKCNSCGKFLSREDFKEDELKDYDDGKVSLECWICWNGDQPWQ